MSDWHMGPHGKWVIYNNKLLLLLLLLLLLSRGDMYVSEYCNQLN